MAELSDVNNREASDIEGWLEMLSAALEVTEVLHSKRLHAGRLDRVASSL